MDWNPTNGEAIKKRLEQLDQSRSMWVSHWKEIADYLIPRKSVFYSATSGEKRSNLIFDPEPIHASELLVASLQAMLFNASSEWFDLKTVSREHMSLKGVKEWLTQCKRAMYAVFGNEGSGFQTSVHETITDLVNFGTGVMNVEEDYESAVMFTSFHIGEVYIAENSRGQVDTVFRKFKRTARQMVQQWGLERLSAKVRDLAKNKPDESVEIVHALFPREEYVPGSQRQDERPVASIYMEIENKHILSEGGYYEMPTLTPRFTKISGERYGRGPAMTALADIKMLNRMAKTALVAQEKLAEPPMLLPDDSMIGPLRTGAGDISYYRAGSGDKIVPLPITPDLAGTDAMMQQRRESIRKIFFNDQLQLVGGTQMTATEVLQRSEEKMRLLGPVLGRMQSEFLGPLIRRVFGILWRAGYLPEQPRQLEGVPWKIEYVSPVAKAQRSHEVQAFMRALETVSMLAQADPGMLDNYDGDKVVRGVHDLYGAPSEFLRDERDVARIRQARAQAQQAEEMRANMERGAGVAKILSDADLKRDSALKAVSGGR